MEIDNSANTYTEISQDLETEIENADNGDEVLIDPETYQIHNIKLTKNITIQGKGDPRDVIIDGEEKSSIFLIRSPDVYVTFKNITFINGLTDDFGGAISIETGHVTVDNCIFINNTALKNTNAGGISNYGTKDNRGYLLLTNSLFINNHADHDGGAVTTCYADSYISNCVFINNSARRDGGAIRVSLYGYGLVEDCIFMFNHADEWGGAYYSWSGESDIRRCIFLNNTGGTNGGAVMVSGNINIQESIIANNTGEETGGSFYIQQPMYNKKTVINIHDNLITDNNSPLGKEVYISWKDTENLYTQFDNNDWGNEDPNDSSVNDPDNVTPRIKVSKTTKTNLFEKLNVDLLDKYSDLVKDYFPDDSLENLKSQFTKPKKDNQQENSNNNILDDSRNSKDNEIKSNNVTSTSNVNSKLNPLSNFQIPIGNSTSHGEDKKAYEINKTNNSIAKQANVDIKYIVGAMIIAFILLLIGYKRNLKEE
ncbi:hypothetical protein [Methanobrevibacter sp.]|uniref:hypothetical protein n=1 Tax=Methanobrevibacter sp. TaxID=66852 RepID=UPI00388D8518